MKVRKNARWLTADERTAFLKALVTLKARKVNRNQKTMQLYDFYPLEHRLVRRRHLASTGSEMPPAQRDGGHGGPAFGAWHREWLRRFELDLQSVDSSVTLPYWDITDHQGTADVIFQDDFMGPNGSGPDNKIKSGYFQESVAAVDRPDWWPDEEDGTPLGGFAVSQGFTTIPARTMNQHASDAQLAVFNTTGLTRRFLAFSGLPILDDIRSLMKLGVFFRIPAFGTFSLDWERQAYHSPGHMVVGGLMGAPPTSPNDPIFFLHHCGVDLVWALWQKRHEQTDPTHIPPRRGPGGTLITRPGHHLEDPMWPWDGTLSTNPEKVIPAPQQPFPPPDAAMRPPIFPDDAFVREVDPGDIVRVEDVLDHHSLQDGTGYHYDVEIPFDLTVNGAAVARIEPYFGDLALTGQVNENSTGQPGPGDLSWEQANTVRAWIDIDTGDLHLRGQLMEGETDFSQTALQGGIDLRHYNQPLAYFDPSGNLHLKGKVETNQPPIN